MKPEVEKYRDSDTNVSTETGEIGAIKDCCRLMVRDADAKLTV